MSVYFKLKIDENKDGKIKAITVRNQKINFGLFTFLHQVVHTAVRMYNGDWDWGNLGSLIGKIKNYLNIVLQMLEVKLRLLKDTL